MVRPTRVDYCQYVLSTPINYTLTHFADHSQRFSHDQINRYLGNDRLRPRHVSEHVKSHLVQTPDGCLIFDDTVIDKRYAREIALAKQQYSGNAGGIINGIGVVTCVYVNPALDRYWLIDYRIYDKQGDGKSKLDHVRDMLLVLRDVRNVAFSTVLMDSWYTSKSRLLYIESLDKTYYCPLKANRLVDDSNGSTPYQRIDTLQWTDAEETFGKRLKLNKFPKNHKVKVFRVAASRRTDYVVTNDLSQSSESAEFRRRLIVTDNIFSMDGDIAPLPDICDLAAEYDAMVLVDDAHGFGVLGKDGRGTVSHFGLEAGNIIQMGTLSKAVGALGGYIAGSRSLIELLINRGRGFIFTTGLPPATVAAANAALGIMRSVPELRQRLFSHAKHLKTALIDLGYTLLPSETQILPVILGSPQRATNIAGALLTEGVFAPAIRPPAVPVGTSRLRLTLMATHTEAEIQKAIDAFAKVKGL